MNELTRVACVEDDADIRAIIELALADLGGLEVFLFPDGAAALEGMEAAAPQLIVLDVMMPGMDGLETLSRLRQRPALAHTPAIFMTAKAQPDELARYLQAGASGVIVKPFDPVTLADEVRRRWAEARAADPSSDDGPAPARQAAGASQTGKDTP